MTRIALCLFALMLVGGCASTKVSDLQEYEGQRLPRPGRIIVHDFAGTPADIPAGSAMAGRYSSYTVPQSPDDIAAGRQLGAAVAKELIAEIRRLGPARGAGRRSTSPADRRHRPDGLFRIRGYRQPDRAYRARLRLRGGAPGDNGRRLPHDRATACSDWAPERSPPVAARRRAWRSPSSWPSRAETRSASSSAVRPRSRAKPRAGRPSRAPASGRPRPSARS